MVYLLALLGISGCYLAYRALVKHRDAAPENRVRPKVELLAFSAVLLGVNLYQFWQLHDEDTIVERFHELYYYKPSTWQQTHWLGVLTQQNPNDAWIHQEIIAEVKPDFIVETGTLHGGSAALWAMVLAQVNPDGRVITIDIEDKVNDARMLPIVKDRVEFLVGSSTDPKIVAEVKKRVEDKKVLVILDSNHSRDHVLAELKAYSPLVSPGSYLIVQDSNLNGHPVHPKTEPGPWEAIDEFLEGNDQFVPDRSREHLLFTMHPRGYLKRSK